MSRHPVNDGSVLLQDVPGDPAQSHTRPICTHDGPFPALGQEPHAFHGPLPTTVDIVLWIWAPPSMTDRTPGSITPSRRLGLQLGGSLPPSPSTP